MNILEMFGWCGVAGVAFVAALIVAMKRGDLR